MSAATIDRRLAGAKVLAGFRGARPHQARHAAQDPDPHPDLVGVGRRGPGLRRDRPGRPRGRQLLRRVLLHPDHDRHRHRLDGQPLGGQQVGHPGHRGHRARLVASSPSRSSASTRTTAPSSSTPTSSSTAPPGRSPSPGPARATRTTAATSSRRTGPTSASWSATCASTPRPSSRLLNRIWAIDRGYTNLLLTQQKLVERTRDGAKVIKRHDPAQSPYQRLIATGVLTPAQQAALTRSRNALHPAPGPARDRPTLHPARTPGAVQDRTSSEGRQPGLQPLAPRRRVLREATNHRWRRV